MGSVSKWTQILTVLQDQAVESSQSPSVLLARVQRTFTTSLFGVDWIRRDSWKGRLTQLTRAFCGLSSGEEEVSRCFLETIRSQSLQIRALPQQDQETLAPYQQLAEARAEREQLLVRARHLIHSLNQASRESPAPLSPEQIQASSLLSRQEPLIDRLQETGALELLLRKQEIWTSHDEERLLCLLEELSQLAPGQGGIPSSDSPIRVQSGDPPFYPPIGKRSPPPQPPTEWVPARADRLRELPPQRESPQVLCARWRAALLQRNELDRLIDDGLAGPEERASVEQQMHRRAQILVKQLNDGATIDLFVGSRLVLPSPEADHLPEPLQGVLKPVLSGEWIDRVAEAVDHSVTACKDRFLPSSAQPSTSDSAHQRLAQAMEEAFLHAISEALSPQILKETGGSWWHRLIRPALSLGRLGVTDFFKSFLRWIAHFLWPQIVHFAGPEFPEAICSAVEQNRLAPFLKKLFRRWLTESTSQWIHDLMARANSFMALLPQEAREALLPYGAFGHPSQPILLQITSQEDGRFSLLLLAEGDSLKHHPQKDGIATPDLLWRDLTLEQLNEEFFLTLFLHRATSCWAPTQHRGNAALYQSLHAQLSTPRPIIGTPPAEKKPGRGFGRLMQSALATHLGTQPSSWDEMLKLLKERSLHADLQRVGSGEALSPRRQQELNRQIRTLLQQEIERGEDASQERLTTLYATYCDLLERYPADSSPHQNHRVGLSSPTMALLRFFIEDTLRTWGADPHAPPLELWSGVIRDLLIGALGPEIQEPLDDLLRELIPEKSGAPQNFRTKALGVLSNSLWYAFGATLQDFTSPTLWSMIRVASLVGQIAMICFSSGGMAYMATVARIGYGAILHLGIYFAEARVPEHLRKIRQFCTQSLVQAMSWALLPDSLRSKAATFISQIRTIWTGRGAVIDFGEASPQAPSKNSSHAAASGLPHQESRLSSRFLRRLQLSKVDQVAQSALQATQEDWIIPPCPDATRVLHFLTDQPESRPLHACTHQPQLPSPTPIPIPMPPMAWPTPPCPGPAQVLQHFTTQVTRLQGISREDLNRSGHPLLMMIRDLPLPLSAEASLEGDAHDFWVEVPQEEIHPILHQIQKLSATLSFTFTHPHHSSKVLAALFKLYAIVDKLGRRCEDAHFNDRDWITTPWWLVWWTESLALTEGMPGLRCVLFDPEWREQLTRLLDYFHFDPVRDRQHLEDPIAWEEIRRRSLFSGLFPNRGSLLPAAWKHRLYTSDLRREPPSATSPHSGPGGDLEYLQHLLADPRIRNKLEAVGYNLEDSHEVTLLAFLYTDRPYPFLLRKRQHLRPFRTPEEKTAFEQLVTDEGQNPRGGILPEAYSVMRSLYYQATSLCHSGLDQDWILQTLDPSKDPSKNHRNSDPRDYFAPSSVETSSVQGDLIQHWAPSWLASRIRPTSQQNVYAQLRDVLPDVPWPTEDLVFPAHPRKVKRQSHITLLNPNDRPNRRLDPEDNETYTARAVSCVFGHSKSGSMVDITNDPTLFRNNGIRDVFRKLWQPHLQDHHISRLPKKQRRFLALTRSTAHDEIPRLLAMFYHSPKTTLLNEDWLLHLAHRLLCSTTLLSQLKDSPTIATDLGKFFSFALAFFKKHVRQLKEPAPYQWYQAAQLVLMLGVLTQEHVRVILGDEAATQAWPSFDEAFHHYGYDPQVLGTLQGFVRSQRLTQHPPSEVEIEEFLLREVGRPLDCHRNAFFEWNAFCLFDQVREESIRAWVHYVVPALQNSQGLRNRVLNKLAKKECLLPQDSSLHWTSSHPFTAAHLSAYCDFSAGSNAFGVTFSLNPTLKSEGANLLSWVTGSSEPAYVYRHPEGYGFAIKIPGNPVTVLYDIEEGALVNRVALTNTSESSFGRQTSQIYASLPLPIPEEVTTPLVWVSDGLRDARHPSFTLITGRKGESVRGEHELAGHFVPDPLHPAPAEDSSPKPKPETLSRRQEIHRPLLLVALSWFQPPHKIKLLGQRDSLDSIQFVDYEDLVFSISDTPDGRRALWKNVPQDRSKYTTLAIAREQRPPALEKALMPFSRGLLLQDAAQCFHILVPHDTLFAALLSRTLTRASTGLSRWIQESTGHQVDGLQLSGFEESLLHSFLSWAIQQSGISIKACWSLFALGVDGSIKGHTPADYWMLACLHLARGDLTASDAALSELERLSRLGDPLPPLVELQVLGLELIAVLLREPHLCDAALRAAALVEENRALHPPREGEQRSPHISKMAFVLHQALLSIQLEGPADSPYGLFSGSMATASSVVHRNPDREKQEMILLEACVCHGVSFSDALPSSAASAVRILASSYSGLRATLENLLLLPALAKRMYFLRGVYRPPGTPMPELPTLTLLREAFKKGSSPPLPFRLSKILSTLHEVCQELVPQPDWSAAQFLSDITRRQLTPALLCPPHPCAEATQWDRVPLSFSEARDGAKGRFAEEYLLPYFPAYYRLARGIPPKGIDSTQSTQFFDRVRACKRLLKQLHGLSATREGLHALELLEQVSSSTGLIPQVDPDALDQNWLLWHEEVQRRQSPQPPIVAQPEPEEEPSPSHVSFLQRIFNRLPGLQKLWSRAHGYLVGESTKTGEQHLAYLTCNRLLRCISQRCTVAQGVEEAIPGMILQTLPSRISSALLGSRFAATLLWRVDQLLHLGHQFLYPLSTPGELSDLARSSSAVIQEAHAHWLTLRNQPEHSLSPATRAQLDREDHFYNRLLASFFPIAVRQASTEEDPRARSLFTRDEEQNPRVRLALQQLDQAILDHVRAQEQRAKPLTADPTQDVAIPFLMENLEAVRSCLQELTRAFRAQILHMTLHSPLSSSITARSVERHLEVLEGRMTTLPHDEDQKQLRWKHLLRAFGRHDLTWLDQHTCLQDKTAKDRFLHLMFRYMNYRRRLKQIDQAQHTLRSLQNALHGSVEYDALYQQLLGQLRPEFKSLWGYPSSFLQACLTMEEVQGILLRPQQFSDLWARIVTPSSTVSVATTGSGKTTCLTPATNILLGGKGTLRGVFNLYPVGVAREGIEHSSMVLHSMGMASYCTSFSRQHPPSAERLAALSHAIRRALTFGEAWNGVRSISTVEMLFIELLFKASQATECGPLSDSPSSVQAELTFTSFRSFLGLLRHMTLNADEPDSLLSPKERHIFPLGQKQHIRPEDTSCLLLAVYFLLRDPELSTLLRIEYNQQSLLTREVYEKRVLPKLARFFAHRFHLPDEELPECLAYLSGTASRIPRCILRHPERQAIALAGELLQELLPQTLQLKAFVHYGPPADPKELSARPYTAGNKPSSALIKNPFERTLKTGLTFATQGLSEAQAVTFCRALLASAEAESQLRNCSPEEMPASQYLRNWLGISSHRRCATYLSECSHLPQARQEIQRRLNHNPEAILMYVQQFACKEISYYSHAIQHTSFNLVSMFQDRTSVGATATPASKGSRPVGTQVLAPSGLNGAYLHFKRTRCNTPESLHIFDTDSAEGLLTQVLSSLFGRDSPAVTLIDAGAVLARLHTSQVVSTILAHVAAHRADQIQGVIFYDERGERLLQTSMTSEPIPYIGPFPTTSDYITYFPHEFRIGANTPQWTQGVGISLISDTTTLTDVQQGDGRMRGSQPVWTVLSRKVKEKICGSRDLTMDAILEFLKLNELQKQAPENYLAAHQKLDNVIYRHALDHILCASDLGAAVEIFRRFFSFFITTNGSDPWELFGEPKRGMAALDAIEEHHQRLKLLLDDELFNQAERMAMENEFREILEEAAELLPENVRVKRTEAQVAEIGIEEEQHLSMEQQQQTQQQQQQTQQQQTQQQLNISEEESAQLRIRATPACTIDCSCTTWLTPSSLAPLAPQEASRSQYHTVADTFAYHPELKAYAPLFSPRMLWTNSSLGVLEDGEVAPPLSSAHQPLQYLLIVRERVAEGDPWHTRSVAISIEDFESIWNTLQNDQGESPHLQFALYDVTWHTIKRTGATPLHEDDLFQDQLFIEDLAKWMLLGGYIQVHHDPSQPLADQLSAALSLWILENQDLSKQLFTLARKHLGQSDLPYGQIETLLSLKIEDRGFEEHWISWQRQKKE